MEISPRFKYLKNNPSEIFSVLFNSGKNSAKINDLEKAIKEQKNINLNINQNNKIKLTLMKNNYYIIGMAEFYPMDEIKWINIKEVKSFPSKDNLLSISSQKNRNNNILETHNCDKDNYEKNNDYYLTTIKNNNLDMNNNLKKATISTTINYTDIFNNNIKIKISTKINSKSKIIINKNKNKSLNPSSTLIRGSSQIILNNSDKNKIINKNNNKENTIKLKKKLKNVKSTSSIKLSLNQFITNNNLSLNSIYTTINSNNKNVLKLNKNKSLIDKKQNTQYNFYTKKPLINDENENNYVINQNYYNNTITLETNNKKIEDLIIDNNFKNKLKSDEIINPNYFNLGNNQSIQINNNISNDNSIKKNINKINPINRDILKEQNPFNNYKKFNKEKTDIKVKERKNNSSLNIPSMKYDNSLFNDNIAKKTKSNEITKFKQKISDNNDEFVKIFEIFKNDNIIYYTKEYLNAIKDDVLSLELKLIFEKIINLKLEYQKQYKLLFNNFINYKNYIKLIQKNYINIFKKNNKLQTKKTEINYLNKNLELFDLCNNKVLSFGKSILDNAEKDIFNNLLNNNRELFKNKRIDNIFLLICKKNVNNLNSLSKRYYLDIKMKKKIKMEKLEHLLQNLKIIYKQKNIIQ